MELLDKDGNWVSIKKDKTALFGYSKWEPGYTEFKVLRIENEGSLALKWLAKFISASELSALADVIDVYVKPSAAELQYPADRNLGGYTNVGTVAQFVDSIKETTKGELKAGEEAYLGIALKMQEDAGNEYQDLDLGGVFDIQIVATQLTYESDSFNDQYDAEATLDYAPVSNANELRLALANKEENIVLTKNIIIDDNYVVDYTANINGTGYSLCRTDGTALMTADAETPAIYTGTVFTVKAGAELTLEDIVVDGGAVWSGEVSSVLRRGTVNAGVTATGALVSTEGNGSVVLGEGAVLQNHYSASAVVSLATRANGTLTLNGGKIINNTVTNGAAVWLGGAAIINDGSEISGNSGTLGGVFRSVDSHGKYNVSITVNGGKITHNTAPSGGVLWSGNGITVTFAGGEIAYNHATSAGGVIWGGSADKYYIKGDVEIHDNTAGELGNAFRFTQHQYSSLEMTGGKLYNNTCEATPYAFYCINNPVSLLDGEIQDDILYTGGVGLTVGEVKIDGVIHFDLSTNHNTAYLAESFNEIEFTVNEADEHFANFNFKPATGYVYTEGDEAKLICLNEGYETYWDTTTQTFRLQAK